MSDRSLYDGLHTFYVYNNLNNNVKHLLFDYDKRHSTIKSIVYVRRQEDEKLKFRNFQLNISEI